MAGERDDEINVSMNSAMSSEELIEVTSTTGDNHRIPQRQQFFKMHKKGPAPTSFGSQEIF